MFDKSCPQCNKSVNGTVNRLVRDSCGHQKCRMCLLSDEEKCQQCKAENSNSSNLATSVIKFEHNHTGVITCNGAVRKQEPIYEEIKDIKPIVTVTEKKPAVKKAIADKEKVKSRTTSKNTKNKRNYRSITVPSHITVSKDPTQYKCNICNKQFATKSHVKYHLYCTGEKKPFQCSTCSKDFLTKSHLDVHMLKHSGSKPYTCHVCQKSFAEKSKLKRHSLLHNSSKPYVCSDCGKAFRSKESLNIHILVHRGEKPYVCKICDLRFNHTSNLNKHLISHSKEKIHMCDQCGKRFKLKWALTVHRRSHLRIRPFECSVCTKAFINNKDLQRHQLIHLDTKAFVCSICKTGFRRKDNLYRHVKNTHPGKKVEPVTSTVKQLIMKPNQKSVVDNPNAINVITASPACKIKIENPTTKPDNRTNTVINGPLKLAFKTSAFKNNYNIHRDYNYDLLSTSSKPYDLAESVNICQKILSPHSPPTRNIIRKVSEPTSTEICQKILSPYPSHPIHYETSFEHKKHAMIKNIKFKLPSNYTNLKANDTFKDLVPLQPTSNINLKLESDLAANNQNTYSELKTVPNIATSVIVNTNLNQMSNMHWRRRTLQNLSLKVTEN